ncbi:sporulation protein [Calidifontibacillus erzurumensis]|uniref:Sporulation protein n=1 Tax=Calidifontibacillus erzurumensis TaxID=2741433 RepID=A0A8J8KAJ0_9BACI|nr:sporulation protein [Calidifontibacillus erzurumensis]NSL50874.1 sporulation protein [Calidifontibacillus erzurumensis]
MSFLDKMFASIGIGAAKVDTILANDRLVAGDEVNGRIVIQGGKIDQDVDDIYLKVMTSYEQEIDDKKVHKECVVGKFRLTERFTIKAKEKREVPFSFELPIDTPISYGKTRVWVETGLDIKNAIDPSDRDYIEVHPSPLMSKVFNAVTDLGFRLREVECEAAPFHARRRLPFVQEFEFVPTKGEFRGRLDELEIIFLETNRNYLELLIQVDRKARSIGGLLSEMLNLDETNLRLTITNDNAHNIKDMLYQVIKKYS